MIAWMIACMLALWPPQDAAQAYRDGRYEEARVLFQTALATPGAARGALDYNLGNCAFRLGAYADAVLHYQRARHFLPSDDSVSFNLRLAQRALGLARPAPAGPVDAILGLLDRCSPWRLLAIIALLQVLAMIFVAVPRRRLRVVAALLLLATWSATARLIHNQWFAPRHAVVLAPSIELRREPHLALAVTQRLHAGEMFEVAEASDRWLRVVHPGGGGWTQRAGIGWVE